MSMSDVTDSTEAPNDYKDRIFIARVMATVDPALCHRVKIMIPDVLEGDVANLPWAIPGSLTGGFGSAEASQWIPEEGSKVYVTLQDGDTHYPVYHGGVPSFESVRGALAVNYPHRVGFQLNSYTETNSGDDRKVAFSAKGPPTPFPETGHHFFIDRSTNDVEYEHAQKTRIHITPNGSVLVEIRDSAKAEGGDWQMDTDRHYKLNVGTKNSPQGNMYVDVENGFMQVHVKKNAEIHVEGDANITVDQNVTATVGGNFTGNVTGTASLTSQGAMTFTSVTGISMIAPTVNMIGAASIGMTSPSITSMGIGGANTTWNAKGNLGVDGNINVTQNVHSGGTVSDSDGVDTA